MSKLKVAISKLSSLRTGPVTVARYSLLEAREMARKFYRENLPKMMTIPKRIDTSPKLNIWLLIIGYLRVNWSDVEKNLTTRSSRILNRRKSSLLLLDKLKNSQFVKQIFQHNSLHKYKLKKMLKP